MNCWNKVQDQLLKEIGPGDFNKWIKPLKATPKGRDCVLMAPNRFILNRVQNKFATTIASALKGQDPSLCLIFSVDETGGNTSATKPVLEKCRSTSNKTHNSQTSVGASQKSNNLQSLSSGDFSAMKAGRQQTTRSIPFNPLYTFDNFVVGDSNEFAHAACAAVSDMPGNHYNPLFIYGGVGLGKTHLLHAIGLEILRNHPQARICYLSSEKFINDLINSLRLKRMDDFRRRFRDHIDVLMIDDVQFIAGKERSQEEFFHTFNALYELKKQIVLTSDTVPKNIPDLEERLRSRFQWGLIADIQAPDFETRMAILKRKAEAQQFKVPDSVLQFLAHSIKQNIRELEGSLSRLNAFATLMGRNVSLELAEEVFKNIIDEVRTITIPIIQKVVAESFHIKVADLTSPRKFRYVAQPRQLAMFLSRKLTNASLPEIGQHFGGRDHSTVLHAVKKIKLKILDDISMKNTCESLEKSIRFGVGSASQ